MTTNSTFFQNNRTCILHGNARRTTIFGAKLKAWRHKLFQLFSLFVSDMVLRVVNPLSWISNVIFNEKSCLISMPFLSTYIDVRTIKFFPPAESWLVNSNFPPASRMQGFATNTFTSGFISIGIIICLFTVYAHHKPVAAGHSAWPRILGHIVCIAPVFYEGVIRYKMFSLRWLLDEILDRKLVSW